MVKLGNSNQRHSRSCIECHLTYYQFSGLDNWTIGSVVVAHVRLIRADSFCDQTFNGQSTSNRRCVTSDYQRSDVCEFDGHLERRSFSSG